MKLLLVRHGKAEDVAPSGSDAERILTDSGRRRMKKIARNLSSICKEPTVIATSPLIRAQETAEILAHEFDECDVTVRSDLEFGAPMNELIKWLSEFEESAGVICVGHEPSLSQLAATLLGCSASLFELRKGGACCLSWDETLVPGKGQLEWLLTPRQLRCIGQ